MKSSKSGVEKYDIIPNEETEVINECARILSEKFALHAGVVLKNDGNKLTAKQFEIKFVIKKCAAEKSGAFKISSSGRKVVIFGQGKSGIYAATGHLLKNCIFKENKVQVKLPKVTQKKPSLKFRGHLLANHPYRNNYSEWEINDWAEYLQEMALWGSNILWTDGIEIYPGVDPLDSKEPYSDINHYKEWKRQSAIQSALPDVCSSYGMDFGVWYPPNGVYELKVDRLLKKGKKLFREDMDHRKYVCPSIKQARELILKYREYLFSRISRIDHFLIPAADNGGCSCKECTPWVKTYLKLCKEQYDLLKKFHPNAKLWLSNQQLKEEGTKYLVKELLKQKKPWVNGIVFGPHGWNLEYLNEKVGKKFDIVLYPDITHTSRSQYQMPDSSYPLNLIVGRESLIGIRPSFFKKIFMETTKYANGESPYSEGIHDDFNKFLWSTWAMDKTVTSDEAVKDYAALYFGYGTKEKFLELAKVLEKNWVTDIRNNGAGIDKALVLLDEIYALIPESFRKNNWRFELFRMETRMFKLVWLWLIKGRKNKEFKKYFAGTLAVRKEIYSLCKLKMVPAYSFDWMFTQEYDHAKCMAAKENLFVKMG